MSENRAHLARLPRLGRKLSKPVRAKHVLMAEEQGWQQELLTLPTEYKRATCRLREGSLEMGQLKGQHRWWSAVSPWDGSREPVSAAWDIWRHQTSCGQEASLQVMLPAAGQDFEETKGCQHIVVVYPAM